MQAARLMLPLLIPYQITHPQLSLALADLRQYQCWEPMKLDIAGRCFEQLWESYEYFRFLSKHCVICGKDIAAAHLRWHYALEHPALLRFTQHTMPQLIAHLTTEYDMNASPCLFCELPFQVPELSFSTVRTAIIDHFQAQCPVVLQIIILLTVPLHGGHGSHGYNRTASSSAAGRIADCVRESGTTLSASERPKRRRTVAGSQRAQAPATQRRITTYGRFQTARASSHGNGAPPDQPRSSSQLSPAAGHVHMLSGKRRAWRLGTAFAQRSRMALRQRIRKSHLKSSQLPVLESRAGVAATSDRGEQVLPADREPALEHPCEETGHHLRGGLELSPLGPTSPTVHCGRQTSHILQGHDGDVHGIGGACHQSGLGGQDARDGQQSTEPTGTLETPSFDEAGRRQEHLGQVGRQHGLDLAGHDNAC